jgi:hypothetical protein
MLYLLTKVHATVYDIVWKKEMASLQAIKKGFFMKRIVLAALLIVSCMVVTFVLTPAPRAHAACLGVEVDHSDGSMDCFTGRISVNENAVVSLSNHSKNLIAIFYVFGQGTVVLRAGMSVNFDGYAFPGHLNVD